MGKITIYIIKSKRKIMRVLLLYGLLLSLVPLSIRAGIHHTLPDPIRFGLVNVASIPGYRLYNVDFHHEWLFSSGGARLYGLNEVQPYALTITGPIASGRLKLAAEGINVASYHEIAATIGYWQPVIDGLKLGMDAALNRIQIDGFGSTLAAQLNFMANYRLYENLFVNAYWNNVTQSEFGDGSYPLPKGFVFGIDYKLQKLARLYFEIEKDSRYSMQSRIAATADVWGPVGVLFGYQTNPDIAALGIKVSHKKINITAAYQYHTDLGISQCYGLSVIF